jgi:hypothetical protein
MDSQTPIAAGYHGFPKYKFFSPFWRSRIRLSILRIFETLACRTLPRFRGTWEAMASGAGVLLLPDDERRDKAIVGGKKPRSEFQGVNPEGARDRGGKSDLLTGIHNTEPDSEFFQVFWKSG